MYENMRLIILLILLLTLFELINGYYNCGDDGTTIDLIIQDNYGVSFGRFLNGSINYKQLSGMVTQNKQICILGGYSFPGSTSLFNVMTDNDHLNNGITSDPTCCPLYYTNYSIINNTFNTNNQSYYLNQSINIIGVSCFGAFNLNKVEFNNNYTTICEFWDGCQSCKTQTLNHAWHWLSQSGQISIIGNTKLDDYKLFSNITIDDESFISEEVVEPGELYDSDGSETNLTVLVMGFGFFYESVWCELGAHCLIGLHNISLLTTTFIFTNSTEQFQLIKITEFNKWNHQLIYVIIGFSVIVILSILLVIRYKYNKPHSIEENKKLLKDNITYSD